MPRYRLMPHSAHPPIHAAGVEVNLAVQAGALRATYRIIGADAVCWPQPAAAGRADELWRTTCFELFLLFDDDERYVEFNFSPSTRWAAYAFDAYREGRSDLSLPRDPDVRRVDGGVAVICDLSGLPRGALRMAITAVVEEEGGTRSFWSLAHPPGAPDFHHHACFVARLPAPA